MPNPQLPVTLNGLTEHFKGNGRKLGYPTANINTTTPLPDGVYFGFADLGQYIHQPSIIFIGIPTTVGDTTRRLEAHLLDIPDIDYYGTELSLTVCYYYRSNQTFSSIKKLLAVMKKDEIAARHWFRVNGERYQQ